MDHSKNLLDGAGDTGLPRGFDASAIGLLAVLANPIRIRVLAGLGGTEKPVRELGHELSLHESTLSHALSVLQDCGLVEYRIVKRHHYYRLTSAITVAQRESMLVVAVSMPQIECTLRLPLQSA